MDTTLYQNRLEDTKKWTNLYLIPHDYQVYYVNIDLRHQYGISAAESQTKTSTAAKSEEKRMFSQAFLSTVQGHPTAIFGKCLFGRQFEI